MFKYKVDGDIIWGSMVYPVSEGIVITPVEIPHLSQFLLDNNLSEKELLIKEAKSLGMAVSKLKRNSPEKIKEAIEKYKEQ